MFLKNLIHFLLLVAVTAAIKAAAAKKDVEGMKTIDLVEPIKKLFEANTTHPTTTAQTEIQEKTAESTNSSKCDPLRFHTRSGKNVRVINDGRSVERIAWFYNAALTSRPLRSNELLEVRLERLNAFWLGGILIGVTVHSAEQFNFLKEMKKEETGTWVMDDDTFFHNGDLVKFPYGKDLKHLKVNDQFGVMRKDDGTLHFYINSEDMGVAATDVPEHVYGFIELWGETVQQASIVDPSECQSFA